MDETRSSQPILGGWTNPFEKYSSNWESSPRRGENRKKYLKPTSSLEVTLPEINSLPLKIGQAPKGNSIFQPSISRCENVSFREGKWTKKVPSGKLTWQ